jgi:hypothetical protein
MREQFSIQEKGSKSLFLAALVVTAALAGACGNSQAKDETKAASNSQPAATPPPVDVATAPAITRNLQRDVEVVGSFAADEEVAASAQAAGELSISAATFRRGRSSRRSTSATRSSRSNRPKPRSNRRWPGSG